MSSVRISILAALLLIPGCSALHLLRPKSRIESHPVDFREAYAFARLSEAAYLSPAKIEARYARRRRSATRGRRSATGGHSSANRVIVRDLPGAEVRFFVVFDDQAGRQDIAVRGTSNLANVRVDVAFTPHPDQLLGIQLHQGFAAAGSDLYRVARPLLKKEYSTTITGHSLGGSLAAILGMYLKADGFRVKRIVTFGQPKVTNVEGARKYAQLPILRFVNRADPVADVPPLMSLRDANWRYTHFGPEVILWTGNRYIFVEDHQALSTGVLSFWSNLGGHEVKEHEMASYLSNLRRMLDGAEEIKFEERARFLD